MEVETKVINKKFEGKKKTQIIITSQPTISSEWKQQSQAGCIFWVHQETGAIRSNPPKEEEREGGIEEEGLDPTNKNQTENEIEATGALVYNSQEYEELLKVLG